LAPGGRSASRVAAQRERERLEQVGISASVLLRCDAISADGTRLAGLAVSDGDAQ